MNWKHTFIALVAPGGPELEAWQYPWSTLWKKPPLIESPRLYSIPFEERPIPSDADVAVIVAERTTALLEARLRSRDKLQTERSSTLYPACS